MPQITAYVNKSDHQRWMRVERKADVIKWLLDRYEAGDIELPTITKKPEKSVPKVADDDIEMPSDKEIEDHNAREDRLKHLPGGAKIIKGKVIKTAEDAKKAVEPIAPHENFFKKSKKKK